MKQILTILLVIGTITVTSAQQGRFPSNGNSRDVVLGQSGNRSGYDNNRYGTYSFTEREKNAQLQRIRHEYQSGIREVQHSRYLRAGEKRRQINMLQMQRDREIRQVNERFYDRRNIGDNQRNHYRNNRRY
ncbi:MAG: hypothetical protein ACXWV0_01660 [Flavisolibacter sp.]